MKLAIFDFDGTLIKINSLSFLLKAWKKLGYPKSKQLFMYIRIGGLYIRYKLGLNGSMTTEQLKKRGFQKFTKIFRGMTQEQIKEFFVKSSEFMFDELNVKVVKEARKAKEDGYYTVLLSGFYQELLQLIADHVGIDRALGTSLIYKDEVIEEKKSLIIRTGVDKVIRIKEEFPDADYKKSMSYADSISDLGLMELVGTPVAVSPDENLGAVAEQRGWRIIG